MERDFEAKKRHFDSSAEKISIKLPVSLARMYKEMKSQHISKAFELSNYKENVNVRRDKLVLNVSLMQSFFKTSCDNIVTHMEEILIIKADESIKTIVLVGGYGECRILLSAIESRFPEMRVIVPEDAGLAVLKGAVIYGHNPGAIRSRVAQRTYGVDTTLKFKEGVHPEEKKIYLDGEATCDDVFDIHITKGQDMRVGESHPSRSYFPIKRGQTTVGFKVYSSTETNPTYVTDPSCTFLGKLSIEVPAVDAGLSRSVSFHFQMGTQITVTAVAKATGEQVTAHMDFLTGE